MPKIHAVILVPDADPALVDPEEVISNALDIGDNYYDYGDLRVESAEWEK
jgi:hypothetical protein